MYNEQQTKYTTEYKSTMKHIKLDLNLLVMDKKKEDEEEDK